MFIPVLPIFEDEYVEEITERLLDSKHFQTLLNNTLCGEMTSKDFLMAFRVLAENEFYGLKEEIERNES